MSNAIDLHNLLSSQFDTLEPFIRPADWLTLPVVLETDQVFIGLVAIQSGTTFVALSAMGDYVVEWGDGTTENVSAAVTAEHQYDFSNPLFDGTLTTSGYKQAIVRVTPQAGQQLTTINLHTPHSTATSVASGQLQKRWESNWLEIALASEFLTHLSVSRAEGYDPDIYTAPIIVTFDLLQQVNILSSALQHTVALFQSTGLRSVLNLNVSPTPSRAITAVGQTGPGDLFFTSPAHGLTSDSPVFPLVVDVGSGIDAFTTYYVFNEGPDSFQLSTLPGGAGNIVTVAPAAYNTPLTLVYGTSFALTFDNTLLTTIGAINTSNAITTAGMFSGCTSLQSLPLMDTSNCRDMSDMFYDCTKLRSVPAFDTSLVVDFSSTFSACLSLQTIPQLNTSAARTLGGMFTGCSSLVTIPLISTSTCSDFNGMFRDCFNLTSVPVLNLTSAVDLSRMFESTPNLKSTPSFITTGVLNFTEMFYGATGIETVALFDTSSGTDFSRMFELCPRLVHLPTFNTSNVQVFANTFTDSNALAILPPLDLSSVDDSFTWLITFLQLPKLRRAPFVNIPQSISVTHGDMSPAALNELFVGLSPLAVGKTVYIYGNWGTPTCDQTIATDKGWIVDTITADPH